MRLQKRVPLFLMCLKLMMLPLDKKLPRSQINLSRHQLKATKDLVKRKKDPMFHHQNWKSQRLRQPLKKKNQNKNKNLLLLRLLLLLLKLLLLLLQLRKSNLLWFRSQNHRLQRSPNHRLLWLKSQKQLLKSNQNHWSQQLLRSNQLQLNHNCRLLLWPQQKLKP